MSIFMAKSALFSGRIGVNDVYSFKKSIHPFRMKFVSENEKYFQSSADQHIETF